MWEKLEIFSLKYNGLLLVLIEYWIYDFDDNFLEEDIDLQNNESDNVDVEACMEEVKEYGNFKELLNSNLIEVSFFSLPILYSSDLDFINSYDRVNGNFDFGKIDQICMNFHKFDMEDKCQS